jgi:hypothetical protein
VCGRIFPFRRILFLPLACSEKFHETFFEFFIVNFTKIYTKKKLRDIFLRVRGKKKHMGWKEKLSSLYTTYIGPNTFLRQKELTISTIIIEKIQLGG